MERILVIGSPGSGKSTFSRALAQRKQLPLVYLDRLFWNADITTVDQAQFDQRLEEAKASPTPAAYAISTSQKWSTFKGCLVLFR